MNMDDNELKNAHKEILRGERDVCVYWIDDCFTNQEDKLGNLPLIQLGKFDPEKTEFTEGTADNQLKADSTFYGDNGATYSNLKKLCLKMKIGFHVCSFEYAELHWNVIDKINHFILMDIGYTGESDKNYGINLYYKMTNGDKTNAWFYFLSGWPERANDVYSAIEGNKIRPHTFSKATGSPLFKYLFDTAENSNETYFEIQINKFIEIQPKDLSSLDVAQWISLRSKMFEEFRKCGEKNKKLERGAPYYDWAHHLPGGGQPPPKGTMKEQIYVEGFEILKKAYNQSKNSFPVNSPDYFWEISKIRWKYPPLRALGQFDSDGYDLTKFFYHLGEYCRKEIVKKIRFDFTYPAGAMKYDYLWFNCAALGEGLITLADGFSQDFETAQEHVYLFWSVNEVLNGECGLEITIRQYVDLKFDENSDDEKRDLRVNPSKDGRIPEKEKRKGRVKDAFAHFKRAGAREELLGPRNSKCDLRLFIPAQKTSNGFWQVKKGD